MEGAAVDRPTATTATAAASLTPPTSVALSLPHLGSGEDAAREEWLEPFYRINSCQIVYSSEASVGRCPQTT